MRSKKTIRDLDSSECLTSKYEFTSDSASGDAKSPLASYPFRFLMWIPFTSHEGQAIGGMLLAREVAWQDHNRVIADQIGAAISYSVAYQLLAASSGTPRKASIWRSSRLFAAVLALVVVLMALPVSMKSLAPFEIIAQEPLIVASPLDSIIEDVLVEPGQPVREGQAVLRFSDTLLRNRLEIARNEVEVSRAKLKKANQMAFEGDDGRQQLGIAMADLSLKEAQYKLAKDQSEETIIRTDRAGVAVYAERQSLLGKPVAIGEQLLSIANPEKVLVRINLHVSDSILLEEGAKVKLFLDSDPLVPRDAIVEYANYRAAPVADGSLAYAITAKLVDDGKAIPRLGIQGSAQLYGNTVPAVHVPLPSAFDICQTVVGLVAIMEEFMIPALRKDIEFSPNAGKGASGREWTIHDPLQHRYFRVNAQTRRLMSLWQGGMTANDLIADAKSKLNMTIDEQEVAKLYNFLNDACLLQTDEQNNWRQIDEKLAASRIPLVSKIVRGHLFFRVPLVKPTRFLSATEHLVKPIYSPIGLWIIFIVGLTGIYLLGRELNAFTQALSGVFQLHNTYGFLIALIFVKLVHELGHAYAATKTGCRVSTMGIAFMVFIPILYTDISDTWRLSSRRQRVLVSSAGVIAELLVASLATFLWVFLEPGVMRDSVLILATASWIMSVGININPLLKFDGYYILSDLTGIENLQSRSFAYTRWWIRRLLFAQGIQAPEDCTRQTAAFFICYATGTWIYRLVIFTAIALVVYQYTFKALGIFLFALEIWLLLLSPLFREISEWVTISHSHFSIRRVSLSIGVVSMIAVGFFAPWSTTLRLSAVLQPFDLTQVYPTRPAKIISLVAHRDQYVEAGDPILIMQGSSTPRRDRICTYRGRKDAIATRADNSRQNCKNRQYCASTRVFISFGAIVRARAYAP